MRIQTLSYKYFYIIRERTLITQCVTRGCYVLQNEIKPKSKFEGKGEGANSGKNLFYNEDNKG